MTTPKERAAALVEAQGDELSRYQRMFLEQDIEREITEAVKDLLEQNTALHALIRRVIAHSAETAPAAQKPMRGYGRRYDRP